MANFSIRNAQLSDLDRCFEIESLAYAGDEAASKDKIRKRIEAYPQGFVVLEDEQHVLGFINAGACHEVALSDEDFKALIGHDPQGPHIVIMSVVIHPEHQGQGLTTPLMKHFIEQMRSLAKTDIYLICQSELMSLYAKYGFIHLGESKSTHGGLSWHEMTLNLRHQLPELSPAENQ